MSHDSLDRAALQTESHITSRMIEVGVNALIDNQASDIAADETVTRIFLAMANASGAKSVQ